MDFSSYHGFMEFFWFVLSIWFGIKYAFLGAGFSYFAASVASFAMSDIHEIMRKLPQ